MKGSKNRSAIELNILKNALADDKIQEIKDSFKNPDEWDDQF